MDYRGPLDGHDLEVLVPAVCAAMEHGVGIHLMGLPVLSDDAGAVHAEHDPGAEGILGKRGQCQVYKTV